MVEGVIDQRWQLVASLRLMAELETVLRRPEFRRWLSEEEAARFVADVRVLADMVPDPPASPNRETAARKTSSWWPFPELPTSPR